MIDKIYWCCVRTWYDVFYKDKIKHYISLKFYEKGDIIVPQHYHVLEDGKDIKGDKLLYNTLVISTKYQITKQEFWETIVLSTLILLFVLFLIYIF